jgi:radical SAM superfamily enzyme YgiQ (UPF0313 family)
MKACFINPPIRDFYYTSIRRQPLGILYLMSFLEQTGCQVSLINSHSLKKHLLPLPSEFSYLKKYLDSQDRMLSFPFKQYCHFGLSYDEIKCRIAASGADVFFISSSFTPYYEESDEIIAAVREVKPEAAVVIGGCHATLYPEYFLQDGGADFVIRGEGEEASAALLGCLETGDDLSRVPNLAYKKGSGTVMNEMRLIDDIDRLPFPARRFLVERDFKAYKRKAASMITSRGCPNRCGFCSARAVWRGSYRVRSVESVLAEVSECEGQFGVTMINFEDDNIFADRVRAAAILEGLVSMNEKSGARLDFTAMNGVSLEKIDEDIVGLMSRAGFRELNLSLMSHSADLQKKHARPFDSKGFARIAAAGRALGMNVRAYFILGLPGQTADEVRDTINFLKRLDVKLFPSVYYNVFSPKQEWKMQRSSAFYNETDELSRDDLVRLFNECRAIHTRS